MANKPFNTYYDERIEVSGAPPPQGFFYLIDNNGTVQKTTFGLTGGFAEFADDSIVTTIATVDTWTAIANTLILRELTPNVVFAANAFTYVGSNSIAPIPIRACMSCKKTGPIDMDYKIGIAINGTPVNASMSVGAIDTTTSFVSTVWYVALQQNDVITMMIKNIGGSDDLILTNGQLSIG